VSERQKPSGPSFGKFRKKQPEPEPQSFHESDYPPSRDDVSIYSEPRDEPRAEYYSPKQASHHITLPQPIPPPHFGEDQTPEFLNMRLEKKRHDNFEKIGELIVKQNQLMVKKEALEKEKENQTKKLEIVTKQQEDAIEHDRFEEADQLELVLTQIKETVNLINNNSKSIDSKPGKGMRSMPDGLC